MHKSLRIEWTQKYETNLEVFFNNFGSFIKYIMALGGQWFCDAYLRIILDAFAFCDVSELFEERSQIVGRDATVIAEVADVQLRLKEQILNSIPVNGPYYLSNFLEIINNCHDDLRVTGYLIKMVNFDA